MSNDEIQNTRMIAPDSIAPRGLPGSPSICLSGGGSVTVASGAVPALPLPVVDGQQIVPPPVGDGQRVVHPPPSPHLSVLRNYKAVHTYGPWPHYLDYMRRIYKCGCRPFVDMRGVVLKSMRTDIAIDGLAVTVSVAQTYKNESNRPLEVVFTMGLGPMAVTALECERDGVVVAGEIKPSAKARDDYDDSVSMGQTVSLGEFNIKNRTFEMSLGNLTTGSTMTVRIKLVAALEGHSAGLWFGLPNDFFPRTGCDLLTTVKASFPDGIDTMTVTQGASTWLADENHEYHSSTYIGAEGVFAMSILPKKKFEPSVLLEENGASRALALSFFPSWEHLDKDLFTPYVEVIFLVDRSGSMGQGFGPKRGGRIVKARETLTLFLSSLPQNCRFQIVGFGGRFVTLFPDGPQLYTPATLKEAQAHVEAMEADLGGTDLLAPLREVLAKPPLPDYPRHVFVLTDGNVNNREDTIAHVLKRRGSSVIHAVGIGTGADAALVQGVAHAGNGLSDMIPDNGDMRGVVIRQLSRALEPTLRKVAVEFVNCKADYVAPSALPPIASGDRLSIFALNVELQEGAAVHLTGIAPDESPFEAVLQLSVAPKMVGKALHLLAAHTVVRELEEQEVKGSDKTIEALGLKYGFVTSKTSFGAMFENEKLPEGEMVAVNVPTLADKSHAVYFRRQHISPSGTHANTGGRYASSSSSSYSSSLEPPSRGRGAARRKSVDEREREGGPPMAPLSARAAAKVSKRKEKAAPRSRLSNESHELESSNVVAIHKSDLAFDSYDYGYAEDRLDDLLCNSGQEAEHVGMGKGTLPPVRRSGSPASPRAAKMEMEKSKSPTTKPALPSRPAMAAPQSAPPAPSVPKSGAATGAKKVASAAPAAGGNDVVLRAAAGQDAVGFWTLEAATALTGIKAKDPSGAASSALFGTALVIEWLAAKHFEQEPEWKLLAQKARTWLKKQQITLKLQGTDFLALARALIK